MARPLTKKQLRQLELYREFMKKDPPGIPQQEELFVSGSRPAAREEKICSVCNNNKAWFSADFGKTWQCNEHRR